MKWIKAIEKLPKVDKHLQWRFIDKSGCGIGYNENGFYHNLYNKYLNEELQKMNTVIEWLDESDLPNEPSIDEKVLQIQISNVIDKMNDGLIYPFTAKCELFDIIKSNKPEPSIQEDGVEEAAKQYAKSNQKFYKGFGWDYEEKKSAFISGYEYSKQLTNKS